MNQSLPLLYVVGFVGIIAFSLLGMFAYHLILRKSTSPGLRVLFSLIALIWCLFIPVSLYATLHRAYSSSPTGSSATVFMLLLLAGNVLLQILMTRGEGVRGQISRLKK